MVKDAAAWIRSLHASEEHVEDSPEMFFVVIARNPLLEEQIGRRAPFRFKLLPNEMARAEVKVAGLGVAAPAESDQARITID